MQYLGQAGVDSGTLMVGDPGYFFADGRERPEAALAYPGGWSDVIRRHLAGRSARPQLRYAKGRRPGLGVVASTGGDGTYDVFAERDADGDLVRLVVEARR